MFRSDRVARETIVREIFEETYLFVCSGNLNPFRSALLGAKSLIFYLESCMLASHATIVAIPIFHTLNYAWEDLHLIFNKVWYRTAFTFQVSQEIAIYILWYRQL